MSLWNLDSSRFSALKKHLLLQILIRGAVYFSEITAKSCGARNWRAITWELPHWCGTIFKRKKKRASRYLRDYFVYWFSTLTVHWNYLAAFKNSTKYWDSTLDQLISLNGPCGNYLIFRGVVVRKDLWVLVTAPDSRVSAARKRLAPGSGQCDPTRKHVVELHFSPSSHFFSSRL